MPLLLLSCSRPPVVRDLALERLLLVSSLAPVVGDLALERLLLMRSLAPLWLVVVVGTPAAEESLAQLLGQSWGWSA